MRVVTVAQMKSIEAEANSRGVSYAEMMARAGNGIAEIAFKEFSSISNKCALGLIGSGNNGGDTLIALEHMALKGWRVMAYLVSQRDADDPLIDQILDYGARIQSAWEDPEHQALEDMLLKAGLVLDGVLGTGFHLPLRADLGAILGYVKDHRETIPVVSVDCPSGIDCDTGEVSPEVVPAKITVCLEAVKTGLLTLPAFLSVGEIHVVNLGLPEDLESTKSISTTMVTPERVKSSLPDRPRFAHKGTFGSTMILAGSQAYTGAALLAGEAAYRVGTGLVQMAVPEPLHPALAGQLPEAVWVSLPHDKGAICKEAFEVVSQHLEHTTAILVGPGISMNEKTGEFIRAFFDLDEGLCSIRKEGDCLPLIIDADGLRWVASIPGWHNRLPVQSILTPHPGEMSILTGRPIREIQANRVETARHFAQAWNQVVVLKGALTVIANPSGQVEIIPVACAALAKAGSGDVLAGMIAGLRAQGAAAMDAAVCGAWLHAQAGQEAMRVAGQAVTVLARDILAALPRVIAALGG